MAADNSSSVPPPPEAWVIKTPDLPSFSEAARSLSNQVFQNPRDFLAVLQKDFGQIVAGPGDGHNITPDALEAYAFNPKADLEGRAAALFAANHFPELVGLSQYPELPTYHGPGQSNFITSQDLEMDQRLASGSVTPLIIKDELEDAAGAAVGAVGAAVAGALTGLTLECPLVALGGFALTLGMTVQTSYSLSKMLTDPSSVEDMAKQDQRMLDGWPQISGQLYGLEDKNQTPKQ